MDKQTKKRAYLIQSLIAGVFIFLAFWVMDALHSYLSVASLGASAFIAFSFPHAQSSRPRFLIGGYCVGTAAGLAGCGVLTLMPETMSIPGYIPACALSVFLAMFVMAVLNFEHPPSAALAVAITLSPNPLPVGIAAIGCIIVLVIAKELVKKYLRNL